MRRLWVRWAMLIVFVAVLGFVFVRLGDWQLDRLDQRRERNAATVGNENSPVQPPAAVFDKPIQDADEWQNVRATGTFDAAHQFVVRYRQSGDQSGYQVVTPLRTPDGLNLLVDRGFVPLAPGQPIPTTAPTPPTGTVSVEGHVRRDEQGNAGAIQPDAGQVRLINSVALRSALPYEVANGYLSAVTVDPAQQGGFQPLPTPELNEGPHFWYAVQWFMFTGIAALGIVVFIRSDLRERREAQAKKAPAGVPGSPDGPGTARSGVRGDGGEQRPGPGDGGGVGDGGRPGEPGGSPGERARPAGRLPG